LEISKDLENQQHIYRLIDISSQIKRALVDLSKVRFWVKAHLVLDKSSSSTHFYCRLVDYADDGRTKTAELRAVAWSSQYKAILRRLKEKGCPDALKNNSEICVLCVIRYHDIYGLALEIQDVDPTFGEAQIDRNRRVILEKLLKEGILRKNADTKLPVAPLRIGLVTSKGSAAYNDFVNTLFSSPYSFEICLAHSSMQGENTAREVIRSLSNLVDAGVDLICIVRGGGSKLDLSWFDDESIARAVINCPVPVWSGIGHEIDRGVVDHCASCEHKTPTAAAQAIVHILDDLRKEINTSSERLKSYIDRIIEISQTDLYRRAEGAKRGYQSRFSAKSSRLEWLSDSFKDSAQRQITERDRSINNSADFLTKAVRRLWTGKRDEIERDITGTRAGFRKLYELFNSELARKADGARRGFQNRFQSKLGNLEWSQKSLQESSKRRICDGNRAIIQNTEALTRAGNRIFTLKAEKISRDILGIIAGFGKLREIRNSELKSMVLRTRSGFGNIFRAGHSYLSNSRLLLQERSRTRMTSKKEQLRASLGRFQFGRYTIILSAQKGILEGRSKQLELLRPENVLKRGFSITYDTSGRVIRSVKSVEKGIVLRTRYIDGYSDSTVLKKEEEKNGN